MSAHGHRRRRVIEPDSHALAHPLLVDWLDSEPGVRDRLTRVLVVGTDADAALFAGTGQVAHATDAGLISAENSFDLVVAVDCLRPEGLDAQLDRLAGAVGAGGRLLVIAATEGESVDVITPAELSPLRAAGLRAVGFDDLAADAPGDPEPGRWLRALYQRGGDSHPI